MGIRRRSGVGVDTQVDRDLAESEAKYRAFFELNTLGTSETRLPDGRFIRVNDALCAITGYTRDELLTMRIVDLTHPDDRETTLDDFGQLVRGERQRYSKDKRYVRRDGSIVWVHLEVSVLRDLDRVPASAISVVENITERKRAEEALLSEERYRAVFELNVIGAAEVDLRDGRYLRANDAYCQMLGYDLEELIGLGFTDITHPDDLAEDMQQFGRLVEGTIPSYRLEKRYVRKDGSILWAQLAATLIRDSAGTPVSELGLVLDITERKRSEQDLQRLATRLLQSQDEERRRIAQQLHDETAQTVLAMNLNLTHLLQGRATLDGQARRVLDETLDMGEAVLQQTRTLSYLLHPPLLDELGLKSALEWYVNGFIKRSGIEVELALLSESERLPAEVETALFRIVQESLTNVHRHSGSGRAWISLAREDGRIVLEVRDLGSGVAAETNLPDGDIESLGVGIAGMQQRMRQLGGQLNIELGKNGTTVTASVQLDGESRRD